MWRTPTRHGKWRSCGRAAETLPASDPLLRPYSPPSADITNTRGGCATGTSAQTPPHHLAGRAGSIQLPVLPQFRFVLFGPRYPSGRILQCDASAAPEVVLLVPTAQLCCLRAGGEGRWRTAPMRCGALQASLAYFRRNCTKRPDVAVWDELAFERVWDRISGRELVHDSK
jgi:hypothetical protein